MAICPICIDSVEKDGKHLGCGHYFHDDCMSKFKSSTEGRLKCPMCRHVQQISDMTEEEKNELVEKLENALRESARKNETLEYFNRLLNARVVSLSQRFNRAKLECLAVRNELLKKQEMIVAHEHSIRAWIYISKKTNKYYEDIIKRCSCR